MFGNPPINLLTESVVTEDGPVKQEQKRFERDLNVVRFFFFFLFFANALQI